MAGAVSRNFLPSHRVLVMLLVLTASASGFAESAEPSVYEAEVPWLDHDGGDRANAFRQALRQVLVKVTGLRRFANAATISSLVENAPGLVQQYQLRTVELEIDGTSMQEPRLWARFDEGAVERLVREAGLPVWSRPRPSVLVWLAAGNEESLLTTGSESSDGITEILRQGTASRGVSLDLPLLDLEDQTRAGPPQLWVESEGRIRAASERYQSGSVLIGRIERRVLWEARWALLLAGTVQRWKSEGDVFELVVDEGVQEALDTLAGHYLNAVTQTAGASIVVSISGVHDLEGYARTLRYLESLDEVESVDVLAVVSGRLRLGLRLRTGVAGLRELVDLGSTLAEDAGDVDGALALRLLP